MGDALNDHGKPIKDSQILVLGVAYKKDVDDVRESPSVVLMERLQAKGASVEYHDPFVPRIPPMREHDLLLESRELTEDRLGGADCVLLATDHSQFDYDAIGRHAPLIVDTRNAMAPYAQYREKVWKA